MAVMFKQSKNGKGTRPGILVTLGGRDLKPS